MKNRIIIISLLACFGFIKCKQPGIYKKHKFWDMINGKPGAPMFTERGIQQKTADFHIELIQELRQEFQVSLKDKGIELKSDKLMFFEVYTLANNDRIPLSSFQLLIEITDEEAKAFDLTNSKFKTLNVKKNSDAIKEFYNEFPEHAEYSTDITTFIEGKESYFIVSRTNNDSSSIIQNININPWTRDFLQTNGKTCPSKDATDLYFRKMDAFFIGYVETGTPF